MLHPYLRGDGHGNVGESRISRCAVRGHAASGVRGELELPKFLEESYWERRSSVSRF